MNRSTRSLLASFLLLVAFPFAASAQLTVTAINGSSVTPNTMANSLLSGSSGIQITGVTYTGANGASGAFAGGTGVVGFANGIILTSGAVQVGPGPNQNTGFTVNNNAPGDPQLDTLVGGATLDAATLQITFIPAAGANQVRFSYVFGSEEYNEYVGDEFNDVFAFFVNGTNFALVPGTNTPVTINNVNCGETGSGTGQNCALFINNPIGSGVRNTELDGITTVLSFTAPVNPGVTNTLRLSIADRADNFLDSAVFIAAGSLTAVTQPSTVSVGVTPSRIRTSGPVVVSWTPVNATSCVPSGGAPGTVFPTPSNNQVTVNVNAGSVRNDVFRVTCQGSSGSVQGTAVLSVGVPPAPAPVPVTLLSAGPGGAAANGGSRNIELSDGGRFVVFESTASNLVAGDTNGTSDIFLRNTQTGALTRVSTGAGGSQLNLVSADAKITRSGSLVYYTRGTGVTTTASGAKTVTNGQICFNNLANGSGNCVSKGPGNVDGNGASNNAAPSGDGGVVVYESVATNLSSQDGNGATSDIFKYTSATNTTEILSLTNAGVAATAPSNFPSVSCNGRNFVFESLAQLVNGAPSSPGVRNIYVTSSTNPGKQLVSIGVGNAAANGNSFRARVTDDGRFVFFESSASNLVAGDTNGVKDIFVRDLALGTTARVSVSSSGAQANAESREPQIPCDGAYMTFESDATNLVAGDTNGRADVFLVNMGTGTVTLSSQSNGSVPNGTSGNGELSPDGTAIGFESNAPSLGGNPAGTVYAGQNPFAVQNYTGAWYDPAQAGHGLFLDQLQDGRLVAWWFTFDPSGAQAWFGGVGQLLGTNAVVSVTRTQGTRFIPNFNTTETSNIPIGTLTFNFTSCSTGRVDFALDSTFGNGFMNLSRLTTPLGVACGPSAAQAPKAVYVAKPGYVPDDFFVVQAMKAVEPTVGPIAGVTGAWYDPAQAGHGLFMENLGDRRLLVWWFTFGPTGGQAWFGGIADITGPTTATINFLKTRGGRWIPNFPPTGSGLIFNDVLGPATITFPNCDGGTINYTLGQGFGNNQMILRPLLRPVGTSCSG